MGANLSGASAGRVGDNSTRLLAAADQRGQAVATATSSAMTVALAVRASAQAVLTPGVLSALAPCRSALRTGSAVVLRGLMQLRCWVLDQPTPPVLLGQCCDRLRPGFLAVALEQKLRQEHLVDGVLVDWRWDSRSGQVHGLLWRSGRLERFHWLPERPHLVHHTVLELSRSPWPLRLLSPSHRRSTAGRAVDGGAAITAGEEQPRLQH